MSFVLLQVLTIVPVMVLFSTMDAQQARFYANTFRSLINKYQEKATEFQDLDYRKMRCPWHIDGLNAELLEVTTGTNAAGAIGQIAKKIDILRNTVSRIHNLRLQCYPSRWQPNEYQRFRILNSDQN